MKIILFLCLAFNGLLFAQEKNPIETTELNELLIIEKNGKAKIDAEKPATFPLGTTAFRNMILRNFRMRKIIPNAEKEFCEIIFVIDKEGLITNVKASGSNQSFNSEAERAILKIKDKWIPAEMNGEKVRYKFRIPLTVNFNK